MAAALIIALNMLFGSPAATQPTAAQVSAATTYVAQNPGIVVTDQQIVN